MLQKLSKTKRVIAVTVLGLLMLVIIGNIYFASEDVSAAGPQSQSTCHPPNPTPPPGSRGGPTGSPSQNWPDCLGAGLTINSSWLPNTAVTGKPFSYTFSLHSGGVKTATEIEIDLHLLANQKFSSFDAGKTDWSLSVAPENITDTVRINAGSLDPGLSSPTITITTIFPDMNQVIVRQFASVTWRDNNGVTSRGGEMSIPIDLSQRTPPPGPALPTPTPSPYASAAGPFVPVPDPGSSNLDAKNWYFAVTGHTLNDQLGFLTYWLDHGAVTVLGFPLSEVYTDADTGFQSQYFERGVLEYHPRNPDPYKVEIRSLGRELGQVQAPISPAQPPSLNSIFYPQTGHWLDGRFENFWQSNGGLTQFGYPITEPITQPDGKVVQWFERARFEYSVSTTGFPLVQLGLVGRESAVSKNYLPY